jgi:hypothetical protein
VCPQGKSAIDAILTAQLFRQFRSSAKFVSAESGADENGSGSYFASVCSGYPPQFPVTADDRRARCGLSAAESRLLVLSNDFSDSSLRVKLNSVIQ